MPQRARLVDRLLRTANQILVLAFDPEMRRIIRHIGENRHQRRRGQTVAQRPIEIRNQRNHQIAFALLPKFREQSHLAAVVHADEAVHKYRHLGRTEGPAFLQHDVVDILHPDACVFAKNVERIEDFLEIYQADFPGPPLLFNDCFQCVGGGAMPAPRVEEDEVKLLSTLQRTVCHRYVASQECFK